MVQLTLDGGPRTVQGRSVVHYPLTLKSNYSTPMKQTPPHSSFFILVTHYYCYLSIPYISVLLSLRTIYYTTTSVQQLQQPPCLSLFLPSVQSTGIMLASKSVKVCNAFLYCSLLVQDANHSKSTDMITLEPWPRLLNLELKVMGIIIGPNLLNLPTPSHEKKQIEREQSSARCVTNKKSINTTKTP